MKTSSVTSAKGKRGSSLSSLLKQLRRRLAASSFSCNLSFNCGFGGIKPSLKDVFLNFYFQLI